MHIAIKNDLYAPQKLHFTVEIIDESESGTFWPNKDFSEGSRTLPYKNYLYATQKLHFTVEIIYESESGTFWPNKNFSKKSRTLS